MIDPDETRQPGLIILCTVMLIIAIVAVSLRFWSNSISPAHHFGYDDLFAFLALVSKPFYRVRLRLSDVAIALYHHRVCPNILVDPSWFGTSCCDSSQGRSSRRAEDNLRRRVLLRCRHHVPKVFGAIFLPSNF